MTNSSKLANHLNKQCSRNHRHVHVVTGKAKNAAIYPDELCETTCKGIREELDRDDMFKRMPRKIVMQ